MRIRACEISSFGHFRDQVFGDLDHPIVCLFGHNEAGKSTFFAFLKAMLYGIYPANQAANPYVPFDGDELRGRLRFGLADGTEGTVERWLRTGPGAKLSLGSGLFERESTLRNQPLPALNHIPRRVFETVYALTLSELAALEGETWAQIQDRLLGSFNLQHVRPASEVLRTIDAEAKQIWRSSRRGQSEVRKLQDHRRSLQQGLREAAVRDGRMRSLMREIGHAQTAMARLKEERETLRIRQEHWRTLIPAKRTLDRIDELRSLAGDVTPFADVPENPARAVAALESTVAHIADEIAAYSREAERLTSITNNVSERDQRVLSQGLHVRRLSARAVSYDETLATVARHSRHGEELAARLDAVAARVLDRQASESEWRALIDVSIADLAVHVRAYRQAAERARLADMRTNAYAARGMASVGPAPWVVMCLAGIVAVAVGLFLNATAVAVVGAVCVVSGSAALVAQRTRRRDLEIRADEDNDTDDALRPIRHLLSAVPVRPNLLADPDTALVTELQQLQNLAEQIAETRRAEEESRQAAREFETAVEAVMTDLGDASVATTVERVARLEAWLEHAEERRARGHAAHLKLEEVEGRRQSQLADQRRTQQELAELTSQLRRLDADPRRAAADLVERREALRKARLLEDELIRRHVDLERLRGLISAREEEGPAPSETEQTAADKRSAQLQDELDALTDEVAKQRAELQQLDEARSMDDIAGELSEIDVQIGDALRVHDRLRLLEGIIKYAEERFRERHQPDVISRANRYVSSVTSGRAGRILYDESLRQIHVSKAESAKPLPIGEPLSRGVRDQIFLLLRLAIVAHLDEGHEKLPIFLDEVLVNWDERRRRPVYDILRQVATERQVFFFTCHPWLRDELADHTGAHTVVLTGRSEPVF